MAQLRIKVTEKTEQIERSRAQFEREQGLLDERIAVTYKQGDLYYLDLVLGSRDIGDFIARTELVRRVIRSNQSLAESLLRTKADLEKAKVQLDRTLDSVQIKRAESEQVEASLKSMRETRRERVGAQQAVYNEKSELLAETKENARKFKAVAEEEERESARIAAELAAASQGGGHYNGVMGWPVPSSYRLTSPFGYRIHPIFHTRKLHTGIDIGAGSGNSIVAAGDGEVIFAGYRGGYGNTVMIDHGDGVVTLYAHQQSGGIRVGVGQSRGQGRPHRHGRQHRLLDRPPPAFRGARQRHAHGPDGVPAVGAARSTDGGATGADPADPKSPTSGELDGLSPRCTPASRTVDAVSRARASSPALRPGGWPRSLRAPRRASAEGRSQPGPCVRADARCPRALAHSRPSRVTR